MQHKQTNLQSEAVKIEVLDGEKVVGSGLVFIIQNDGHDEPYGLLEGVYIDENYRSQGLGKKLVQDLIDKAKELGCYKILATSRFERESVHALYEKFGFRKHGYSFRMDLIPTSKWTWDSGEQKGAS